MLNHSLKNLRECNYFILKFLIRPQFSIFVVKAKLTVKHPLEWLRHSFVREKSNKKTDSNAVTLVKLKMIRKQKQITFLFETGSRSEVAV